MFLVLNKLFIIICCQAFVKGKRKSIRLGQFNDALRFVQNALTRLIFEPIKYLPTMVDQFEWAGCDVRSLRNELPLRKQWPALARAKMLFRDYPAMKGASADDLKCCLTKTDLKIYNKCQAGRKNLPVIACQCCTEHGWSAI